VKILCQQVKGCREVNCIRGKTDNRKNIHQCISAMVMIKLKNTNLFFV
jgi:hypothetical protein